MKRVSGWLCLTLALQGCGHRTEIRDASEADRYDPATTARVRILFSPETSVTYLPGATCERFQASKPEPAESLSSLQAQPNRVIGIPPSLDTESAEKKHLAYVEYVVPANQPTLFKLGDYTLIEGRRTLCPSAPAVLIPRAGKDYEVALWIEKTSFVTTECKVVASELADIGQIRLSQWVDMGRCAKTSSGGYRGVSD